MPAAAAFDHGRPDMTQASPSKPNIPAEFHRPDNWMGLYYIAHGLMLWLLPSYAAYRLFGQETLPLAARMLAIAALLVLSGFGLFFMALLGHEGFHGSMNSNRTMSMCLGIVSSCAAPGFVSVGYNVVHWQHHLHTNTSKDPDYQLYRHNKTLFARLLNGPRATAQICLRNALRLVFAPQTLDKTYPFSQAEARRFAVFNLSLATLVWAAYAVLAVTHFRVFVFMVAVPTLVSQTYWAMAPYIEHAQTQVGEGRDTRTCTSKIMRCLLMGYNFHICHHLYPKVQLHKLPALHRHLEAIGYLPGQAVVERGLLNVFKIGGFADLEFAASDSDEAARVRRTRL
jgi:fatty acid desaturase